jgi:hypothetical protein
VTTSAPGIEIPIISDGLLAADYSNMPKTGAKRLWNWVYRDGEMLVRPGYSVYGDDIDERPMAYVNYRHNDGNRRLVLGTPAGWWEYNGGAGTWTDITDPLDVLTGQPENQQIFRVFDVAGVKTLLGTNFINTIKKWNGTDANYTVLAGSPPRAKCMAVAFDRLLLGNLNDAVDYPNGIDVSDNKNPESGWGNIALQADTPGDIVSMLEAGKTQVAIYKDDAIVVATAQAALYPFSYDFVKTEISGPMSAKAVIPIEDGLHIYLANDGSIQLFDLVNVTPVSRAAQKHILATINNQKLGRVWGFYDAMRREVWFVYPGAGSDECSRAVILSRDGYSVYPVKWSIARPSAGAAVWTESKTTIGDWAGLQIQDLEGTLGSFTGVMPRTLVGDYRGQTYLESGETDGGTPIVAEVETGFINLGDDPRHYATVHEVEYYLTKTPASQLVGVQIGISDGGEDPEYQAQQIFDLAGNAPYTSEHRDSAKRLSLKMQAAATNSIRYRGALVSATKGGRR